MAQVSSSTWAAFMEVNRLYEIGKLKGQKFSPGDVVKGTLAIKQWHMKPLVSLPDETKLFLLNKVKVILQQSGMKFCFSLHFVFYYILS